MDPISPRLHVWMTLSEALLTAAETGAKRVALALRPKRAGSYTTRRPGYDTPMWNVVASLVRGELTAHGAKIRLARHLGIPRQRLNDYLTGRSRLPDAELTLRLLHWLAEKRAGRDVSL